MRGPSRQPREQSTGSELGVKSWGKTKTATDKGYKPRHDPHNFSFSANKNENSEVDESF